MEKSPPVTPRHLFDLIARGGVILIGGLQMAHVKVGVLTAQGADRICPAPLYVMMRRKKLLPFSRLARRPGPILFALAVLVPCFVWEFCQRYDLSRTPRFFTRGHFDPYDLLAYAVGVGIPFTLDLAWPAFEPVTSVEG